jgi:hypothetical protein
MCTSQELFKNDNYNCIVLEDKLEDKVKAKEREAILIDMKDYQKAYKKEYRKKPKYPLLNFSLRYFM